MDDLISKYNRKFVENISNVDMLSNNFKIAKKNIKQAKDKKRSLYFFGNGASNTIATHSALDFANNIGMPCYAINDSSVLTAYSNDFGYENAIDRYIKIYMKKDDVLILISSSGQSKNIINAGYIAKEKGIFVISFTGFDKNNILSKISNLNFYVDSNIYNIVESIHFYWLAMLCDYIIEDEKHNIGKHGIIL